MNKTILSLLVVFFFLLSSCTNNQITVEGQLKDDVYNGKTIYLYAVVSTNFDEPKLLSTATVENNKFVFSHLEENEILQAKEIPTIAFLSTIDFSENDLYSDEHESSPVATLVLEQGRINVVFDENSVILSGTQKNEKFNEMHQAISDIVSFAEQLGEYGHIDNVAPNAEGKDGRAQFEELNVKLKDLTYQFTKDNMLNNLGQFLFLKSYQDNMFTPNQMKDLISRGTDTFKALPEVSELQEILETMGDDDLPEYEEDIFEEEIEE